MKIDMPRLPAALSVRASTNPKSATGALWIQILPPFRIQPSPSRTCRGADARDIGARLGLGDAVGDLRLHLQDVGQQCALTFRPMPDEQGRDQFQKPALVRHARIAARELLHHHGIGQRIEARTRPSPRARRCRTGQARPSGRRSRPENVRRGPAIRRPGGSPDRRNRASCRVPPHASRSGTSADSRSLVTIQLHYWQRLIHVKPPCQTRPRPPTIHQMVT